MRFTDIQKINICAEYNSGKSASNIAKELKVHTSTICSILETRGIKRRPTKTYTRKYSIDESYFDKIDSEEKAYFLGLLWADGYNCTDKGFVRICLVNEDKDILEKFRKAIKHEKSLTTRHLSKKHPTWKDQKELLIRSKHISNTLFDYGCYQNKSIRCNFPSVITKDQEQHFVRGYFDGDGSVRWTVPKNNNCPKAVMSFVATSSMCKKIQIIIKKHCNIEMQICKHNSSTKVLVLQICGNNQIKSILDWIYLGSKIYLKRKHKKYLDLIKLTTNEIKRENILSTRNTDGFWYKNL